MNQKQATDLIMKHGASAPKMLRGRLDATKKSQLGAGVLANLGHIAIMAKDVAVNGYRPPESAYLKIAAAVIYIVSPLDADIALGPLGLVPVVGQVDDVAVTLLIAESLKNNEIKHWERWRKTQKNLPPIKLAAGYIGKIPMERDAQLPSEGVLARFAEQYTDMLFKTKRQYMEVEQWQLKADKSSSKGPLHPANARWLELNGYVAKYPDVYEDRYSGIKRSAWHEYNSKLDFDLGEMISGSGAGKYAIDRTTDQYRRALEIARRGVKPVLMGQYITSDFAGNLRDWNEKWRAGIKNPYKVYEAEFRLSIGRNADGKASVVLPDKAEVTLPGVKGTLVYPYKTKPERTPLYHDGDAKTPAKYTDGLDTVVYRRSTEKDNEGRPVGQWLVAPETASLRTAYDAATVKYAADPEKLMLLDEFIGARILAGPDRLTAILKGFNFQSRAEVQTLGVTGKAGERQQAARSMAKSQIGLKDGNNPSGIASEAGIYAAIQRPKPNLDKYWRPDTVTVSALQLAADKRGIALGVSMFDDLINADPAYSNYRSPIAQYSSGEYFSQSVYERGAKEDGGNKVTHVALNNQLLSKNLLDLVSLLPKAGPPGRSVDFEQAFLLPEDQRASEARLRGRIASRLIETEIQIDGLLGGASVAHAADWLEAEMLERKTPARLKKGQWSGDSDLNLQELAAAVRGFVVCGGLGTYLRYEEEAPTRWRSLRAGYTGPINTHINVVTGACYAYRKARGWEELGTNEDAENDNAFLVLRVVTIPTHYGTRDRIQELVDVIKKGEYLDQPDPNKMWSAATASEFGPQAPVGTRPLPYKSGLIGLLGPYPPLPDIVVQGSVVVGPRPGAGRAEVSKYQPANLSVWGYDQRKVRTGEQGRIDHLFAYGGGPAEPFVVIPKTPVAGTTYLKKKEATVAALKAFAPAAAGAISWPYLKAGALPRYLKTQAWPMMGSASPFAVADKKVKINKRSQVSPQGSKDSHQVGERWFATPSLYGHLKERLEAFDKDETANKKDPFRPFDPPVSGVVDKTMIDPDYLLPKIMVGNQPLWPDMAAGRALLQKNQILLWKGWNNAQGANRLTPESEAALRDDFVDGFDQSVLDALERLTRQKLVTFGYEDAGQPANKRFERPRPMTNRNGQYWAQSLAHVNIHEISEALSLQSPEPAEPGDVLESLERMRLTGRCLTLGVGNPVIVVPYENFVEIEDAHIQSKKSTGRTPEYTFAKVFDAMRSAQIDDATGSLALSDDGNGGIDQFPQVDEFTKGGGGYITSGRQGVYGGDPDIQLTLESVLSGFDRLRSQPEYADVYGKVMATLRALSPYRPAIVTESIEGQPVSDFSNEVYQAAFSNKGGKTISEGDQNTGPQRVSYRPYWMWDGQLSESGKTEVFGGVAGKLNSSLNQQQLSRAIKKESYPADAVVGLQGEIPVRRETAPSKSQNVRLRRNSVTFNNLRLNPLADPDRSAPLDFNKPLYQEAADGNPAVTEEVLKIPGAIDYYEVEAGRVDRRRFMDRWNQKTLKGYEERRAGDGALLKYGSRAFYESSRRVGGATYRQGSPEQTSVSLGNLKAAVAEYLESKALPDMIWRLAEFHEDRRQRLINEAIDELKRDTRARAPLSWLFQKQMEETLTSTPWATPIGKKGFKLFPCQVEALVWMLSRHKGLLAHDMGLGKTFESTVACYLMSKALGGLPVVVISPTTTLRADWLEQISDIFDHDQDLKAEALQRGLTEQQPPAEGVQGTYSPAPYYQVRHGGSTQGIGDPLLKEDLPNPLDALAEQAQGVADRQQDQDTEIDEFDERFILVIDEVHKYKETSARTTSALMDIASGNAYRATNQKASLKAAIILESLLTFRNLQGIDSYAVGFGINSDQRPLRGSAFASTTASTFEEFWADQDKETMSVNPNPLLHFHDYPAARASFDYNEIRQFQGGPDGQDAARGAIGIPIANIMFKMRQPRFSLFTTNPEFKHPTCKGIPWSLFAEAVNELREENSFWWLAYVTNQTKLSNISQAIRGALTGILEVGKPVYLQRLLSEITLIKASGQKDRLPVVMDEEPLAIREEYNKHWKPGLISSLFAYYHETKTPPATTRNVLISPYTQAKPGATSIPGAYKPRLQQVVGVEEKRQREYLGDLAQLATLWAASTPTTKRAFSTGDLLSGNDQNVDISEAAIKAYNDALKKITPEMPLQQKILTYPDKSDIKKLRSSPNNGPARADAYIDRYGLDSLQDVSYRRAVMKNFGAPVRDLTQPVPGYEDTPHIVKWGTSQGDPLPWLDWFERGPRMAGKGVSKGQSKKKRSSGQSEETKKSAIKTTVKTNWWNSILKSAVGDFSSKGLAESGGLLRFRRPGQGNYTLSPEAYGKLGKTDRLIKKVGARPLAVIALTGTPAPNGRVSEVIPMLSLVHHPLASMSMEFKDPVTGLKLTQEMLIKQVTIEQNNKGAEQAIQTLHSMLADPGLVPTAVQGSDDTTDTKGTKGYLDYERKWEGDWLSDRNVILWRNKAVKHKNMIRFMNQYLGYTNRLEGCLNISDPQGNPILVFPPKNRYLIKYSLTPEEITRFQDLIEDENMKSAISRLVKDQKSLATQEAALDGPISEQLMKKLPATAQFKTEIFLPVIKKLIQAGEKVVIFTKQLEFVQKKLPIYEFIDVLDEDGKPTGEKESLDSWLDGHGLLTASAMSLTSEMSEDERAVLKKTFQTDPTARIFITTYEVGGVGLTLTKSCHLILLDRDWTPASARQAEDRIWRIGQNRPANIWYVRMPQLITRHEEYKHQEASLRWATAKKAGKSKGPPPELCSYEDKKDLMLVEKLKMLDLLLAGEDLEGLKPTAPDIEGREGEVWNAMLDASVAPDKRYDLVSFSGADSRAVIEDVRWLGLGKKDYPKLWAKMQEDLEELSKEAADPKGLDIPGSPYLKSVLFKLYSRVVGAETVKVRVAGERPVNQAVMARLLAKGNGIISSKSSRSLEGVVKPGSIPALSEKKFDHNGENLDNVFRVESASQLPSIYLKIHNGKVVDAAMEPPPVDYMVYLADTADDWAGGDKDISKIKADIDNRFATIEYD